MASYTLRKLDPETIARAKARAVAHGTTLDDVLRGCLESCATHGPRGAAGGRARAEALTPERRSEIARQAALARHNRHP